MQEIGIITHYGVHNHGAQLQLFALITMLRNKGHECAALQFEKDYRYMGKEAKNKYSISIKSLPYYAKYLLSKGVGKTLFNIEKKRIFDNFRTFHNILGVHYEKFYGDLTIVGSDEVFSFETGVTDAFWGKNCHSKKLVSYAASFGPTTTNEIYEKHLEQYVSDGLNRFSFLSVRDRNSANIVSEFSKNQVIINCDPVIFYGYSKEIEKYSKCLKKTKPYILVYSYDNNMNTNEDISLIRSVSKALNLPVYSVGFYHRWCDKNINANPLELLGWFKNASYIITDTFHGTVLSLITHSLFATKVRGNSNKLCNLLAEYGLENRIFANSDLCLKILKTPVDYDTVEQKMYVYRQDAEAYLNTVLNNLENINE